jgi:hypothetical protein
MRAGEERLMGAPNNLTTSVEVCEDTDKTFNLVDLLVAAGYTPTAPVTVTQALVTNPDGTISPAPTSLVRLTTDGSGMTITASNEANWYGSLSSLNLVVEVGVQTFTVRVNITVLPVNDAPEGTDHTIALTDDAGYVLKESDFGFHDPVEGDQFKSVVLTTLPTSGQLLLNGVALVAGAEVSVQDIRAGALVYRSPASGAGPVGFDFQVRDDGGTANCNGQDLDLTPNRITFAPELGSLGDRVWLDANRNGIQDTGEAGVAGINVVLTGAGADGAFGTADDVFRTTTTNAQGNYLFDDLASGQYRVTFNAGTTYTFTGADRGSNDAADSDANASGATGVVQLGIGEHDLTVDAGLVLRDTNTAKLGDRLWYDADRDGVQDTGETGVVGATVTLAGAGADGVFGTADDISRTTTTNSTGNYLFSNLAAGQYRVTFGAVAGYDFTTANVGNDATDSDANASGVSHTVTLGIGQSNLTVDAGLVQGTGAIGDFVWFDYGAGASYHNNLQDSNETTLPYLVYNTKVELHDAGTGALLQTTYTGTDGKYLFTGVNAGNYYLTFDNTNASYYDAYYQRYMSASAQAYVSKDAGSDDTRDSDVYASGALKGRTDSFYLAQGQVDLTRDFGITPIVMDLDGNGIQTVARQASDASFDLFGNGSPVHSGWISGGDGFLAVDSNGNGRIDDIGELFGGNAKGAGFAKLASFDSNGDGLVDSRDAAFGELRVWVDADGNRQTDAGELRTLAEAGVAALTVDYVEQPFLDAQGNLHLERSSASLADGSVVDMTDVYFNVDAADAQAAGVALPTMAELLGVDDALLQQAFGAGTLSGQAGLPAADLGFDAAAEAQRAIAEAMKHAEASLSVSC